jgi:hypothetical protein
MSDICYSVVNGEIDISRLRRPSDQSLIKLLTRANSNSLDHRAMSAFRAHVAQFICAFTDDSPPTTTVFNSANGPDQFTSNVNEHGGTDYHHSRLTSFSSLRASAAELNAAADKRVQVAKRKRSYSDDDTIVSNEPRNVKIQPTDKTLPVGNDVIVVRRNSMAKKGTINFKIEKAFKHNVSESENSVHPATTVTNAPNNGVPAKPIEVARQNVPGGGVPRYLREGLDLVFCGINPGTMSGRLGHHYARPGNCFYKILFESGLTKGRRVTCNDDKHFMEWFDFGMTNVCRRVTKSAKVTRHVGMGRSCKLCSSSNLLTEPLSCDPVVGRN